MYSRWLLQGWFTIRITECWKYERDATYRKPLFRDHSVGRDESYADWVFLGADHNWRVEFTVAVVKQSLFNVGRSSSLEPETDAKLLVLVVPVGEERHFHLPVSVEHSWLAEFGRSSLHATCIHVNSLGSLESIPALLKVDAHHFARCTSRRCNWKVRHISYSLIIVMLLVLQVKFMYNLANTINNTDSVTLILWIYTPVSSIKMGTLT